MKNKLKIFLCFVMIFVFCFGTCSTAFAATGYPKDIDQALGIVNSYYKDELVGSVPVFYYTTDNKGPALLFLPDVNYSSDTISLSDHGDNGNFVFKLDGRNMYIFTFDKMNCYSKPTMEVFSNVWHHVPYGVTINNCSERIIASFKTILDIDGTTVLFQQGTSQSPNPNPPTPPSTPGSNSLSNTLNKNSEMLKGVLNEIVVLLPLLIPLLISLLAIRKGIKFTLKTLRSC